MVRCFASSARASHPRVVVVESFMLLLVSASPPFAGMLASAERLPVLAARTLPLLVYRLSGFEALQCSCSFSVKDLGRSKTARAVADGEVLLVNGEAIAGCSL
ncbi:Uncharacterized protein HZ326_31901, partial [Fusarium oxysporum f. sp. albedinis]